MEFICPVIVGIKFLSFEYFHLRIGVHPSKARESNGTQKCLRQEGIATYLV
jgi:hypothetical protein